MQTTELLHYAFRAREPLALGKWYAELFDGQFFLHPVMAPLGIVIVKLNHPDAVFDGLLEFWPWDVEWDGHAAAFRKIEPRPTPTSYGHVALKTAAGVDEVRAELERRGVPYRMEPRAPGLVIPCVDDPEGNMVELFPAVDHIPLPPEALCPPEQIDAALEHVRRMFEQRMAEVQPKDGVPLMLYLE